MKHDDFNNITFHIFQNCFSLLRDRLTSSKEIRHILKGLEGWIMRLSVYFDDVKMDGDIDED